MISSFSYEGVSAPAGQLGIKGTKDNAMSMNVKQKSLDIGVWTNITRI